MLQVRQQEENPAFKSCSDPVIPKSLFISTDYHGITWRKVDKRVSEQFISTVKTM